MTPVTVWHRERRMDSAPPAKACRAIVLLPDGQIGIATMAEDGTDAKLEFAFPLADAQFYAERILSGDMGAARKPGMSRLLAAALMVMLKAGMAGGVLAEKPRPPDNGAVP